MLDSVELNGYYCLFKKICWKNTKLKIQLDLLRFLIGGYLSLIFITLTVISLNIHDSNKINIPKTNQNSKTLITKLKVGQTFILYTKGTSFYLLNLFKINIESSTNQKPIKNNKISQRNFHHLNGS